MLEATPSHVVETLEFQFLFEDGREATEQHLAWGDFAAGPALQIVDEVFSERSTGEVTLRLDRLEIDLGRLRAEDFQQAAPDRLRRSLREALREALGAAGAASDDVPSDARSGRQNDFDLVWYVLTHGRPPWRAAYMSGAKYEAAVERVLAQDGETLAQALLASPRQAMLFTRIARQWPRPRRDALARFLDSATPAAAQALQFDRSTPMDRLPAYPDAPAETAGHALRAAFETGLAEARLIGPAFDALIVADQTYLRARLRQAALGPGWRAHFAAGLSSDRRQVLAALFMAPQEAAAALSFAANAVSWQGACQASAEAVSAALNEGLISALLAPGPTRIALTDTLGGMVRAVADLENAHPALLARRLLQAHPKPTGLQPDLDRRLQRLMPPPETSAQSAGQAGEPHTRGDDPASRSALATQEPSLTAIDGLWRLSPEALLDRITILAQGAGWRRALAQDLAVGRRWSRLLPLCAEADDAALVLDLLARPGGWSQGDGQRGLDLQLVQGQALLSHIFVEQHGRLNLADGLASLVAVRAEFDRVTVAEAARTLLATWTPHAVAEPSDRTGLDAQPMPGPTLAEPAGRGATARSDDQPDETSRKTPPQPSDGTGLDMQPVPGPTLAEPAGRGATARSDDQPDETFRKTPPQPSDGTGLDMQPVPGPTLAEPAGRGATARSDDQPDETSRKTPPQPSDGTGLDMQPMPGPALTEPAERGATARSDDQPDETSRKTPPQPSDGTGLDTRPRPGHALAERVGYGAMARSGSEADETSGREALPRPLDQTRRDAPSQARGVLERLARDDAVTGRPRSGGDQDAARWREALQRQLDDARLDAQPWALLAALDPVWLAETLRRRGHRSAWRRTFARNLGPADIRRILALWAPPAEADVFTVLAERAGEWLPKLGEGTRDPTATVRLWLLDYLLVARRRAFESEAVFADLVERAAETSGLSFPQIFARLHATRPPLGRDAPEALERLEAAALALAGKATSSIITDPGDLGAPAARSRREMLRGALRAALEDGARPGMGSAPWREALADDKAWLIAELWRQGRRREIRNALVHELPPDFLLDLAAAATAAEARLLLTKAAPGPEARAEVLRNFWTTVLDALWGESSTPREALARALWAWARRQENLTRARAFRALRQYANRGRNDTAADAEDGASPVEARWRDLLRRQRRPEAEPAIRAISLLSGALAASGANPLVFEHRERLLAEFNTRVVLGEFFREGRRFDPTGFAIGWFNALIAETGTADPAPWREAIAAALESGVSGGGEADRLVLAKALRTGDAQTSPQVATVPARRMTTTPVAEDVDYVANAGMVLAGPYLPMLFGRLGLLHEGVFAEGAAQRAVHLLQFLVDGGPPRLEHELVLNKLLCGLDLDEPIEATFDITPDELETIEGLLRAMIQRWTALGSTSIAGLRETFLQRRGALSLKPELWRLRVEPRAFDVLLDRIPWGFTTLKPPWMKQVLHVDWR